MSCRTTSMCQTHTHTHTNGHLQSYICIFSSSRHYNITIVAVAHYLVQMADLSFCKRKPKEKTKEKTEKSDRKIFAKSLDSVFMFVCISSMLCVCSKSFLNKPKVTGHRLLKSLIFAMLGYHNLIFDTI